MIDEKEIQVMRALDELNIPYIRYEHESANTMERCENIGSDVGARHCKNLFLSNRQCTDFYLLLLAADKKFRTAEVSRQLEASRLSFCSDELLYNKLGVLPGAVTPMALYRDSAKDITVVIDQDVADRKMICVHPCVSTASYAIPLNGLMRFLGSCGNEIRYVTIT